MPPARRTVLHGLSTLGLTSTVAGSALATADGGEAGLRVAHAAPDAPAVDVAIDGTVVVADLSFRAVTDYLELPAGEYDIAVRVAGTSTTVFAAADVDLAAEDYTAVARGEVSSDDTAFTVSLFEDTNVANLADDEARIRAVHASPDAPAVDVPVNDGALTLFEAVTFGESSGYAVVPAASYEVEVRPAGGGDPVFAAELTLEGASTYSAFAVSYLRPTDEPAHEAFGLVPTLDAGPPPRGDGAGGRAGGNGAGGPP